MTKFKFYKSPFHVTHSDEVADSMCNELKEELIAEKINLADALKKNYKMVTRFLWIFCWYSDAHYTTTKIETYDGKVWKKLIYKIFYLYDA